MEVFFEELGVTFVGEYQKGTDPVLYPVDNSHPGESADFEIDKVLYENVVAGECTTVDITEMFFALEGFAGLDTGEVNAKIIDKIEGV